MSVQDNLIIIKNDELPGVDLARADYSMTASFQPTWTEITKSMWKDRGTTYIGVREYVDAGDIIKIGSLLKKYKVMKLVRVEGTMNDSGGRIIQIKRIDGNFTTSVDLDSATVGKKVKVLGRRNFIDQIDHPLGRDYVEPCPIEYKTTLPCDPEEDCDCNCD